MSSTLIITEKQLLKYYKDFGKDLPNSFTSKENRFVSKIGRELFETYQGLISNNYDLLDEHILKADSKNITLEVLEQIKDTSYQVDKIKEYEKELNTAFYCDQISDEIFTNLPKITEKKNNHNVSELKKTIDNINNLYSSIESNDSQELYTVKEYMEWGYEEELLKRFNGIPQTTGCDHLDGLLMNRVSAGLMTIGGWSGSGKTSATLGTIFSSRLIKDLPQAWMGTELSKLAMQDHLMSMVGEVRYQDLFEEVSVEVEENNGNDNPKHEKILKALKTFKKRMDKFKRTLICGSTTISVKQMKSLILNARKQVGCKEDELFVFEIDLMSMVQEFSLSGNGMNRADGIELAVNEVNNIALETNTLIIGTVQLRRKEVKEINNPSELQKYRPTRFDIKSAGAYVERSRYVILLVNDLDTVRKSNSSDFIIDLVSSDPVIEMVLDKCTYAEAGRSIFYHVDWEYRRFYPAKDYECPWKGLEEEE